jgi:hypothetical protein
MLRDDAQQFAGPPHSRSGGRIGHRWVRSKGKIGFHGGKVAVPRPRVRSYDGHEVWAADLDGGAGRRLAWRWAMNLMLMQYLSVEEYDRNETAARIGASYPAIRAFSPVAFAQVNFPARVSDERELRRYADIMYELLPRQEWLETKRYSEREVEEIRRLVQQIQTVTASLFGRSVQPLMCLFPPIPIVRAVEAIAHSRRRRLRVLEIGPGSAHLGAYLLNLGHQYFAMENCQALYLWQNRFLVNLVDEFSEWAMATDRGKTLARCVHIPWWHFATFHEALPISADIVICDAAMGEMDTFALYYILRLSEQIVSSSDCGSFIFQNLGEERVNQRARVDAIFQQLGFKLRQVEGVSIYCARGNVDGVLRDATRLPPLGSANANALSAPSDFLSIDRSQLLESYGFFDFIKLGV